MKLPRFDKSRILVFGDVMLDRYWHGSTDRISAEAPIPVVDIQTVEDRLGGAANVALNVASLGGAAGLVGAVGYDDSAQIVRDKLSSAGIEDCLVSIADRPTSTKFRIMSRKQQMVRADFESTVALVAQVFMPVLEERLGQYDALVLSDYDKGVLAESLAAIEFAKKMHKPVLVDPKLKDFSAYAGATLVKPNQNEFKAAVGGWQSEREMVEKARIMMSNLGFGSMLITRGADGMTLVQQDSQELHLPARSREVFDVSGAGDTVIATLAAALASGVSLTDAVQLCNISAGIVVTKLGTASVSGPELRLEVAEQGLSAKGIMTSEQLSGAVNEAHANGQKVVFTNGCFDILHAGHVEYLTEARQKGDRLIVAINDDEGVKRLKGNGRPINSLERRQTMLSGLEAVDWVVSFAEDTPESLLTLLQPDVLVKGGDYSVEQVIGADIVASYGGEVSVLKLVDGLSTTSLAEKIKRL
ncbi:MAG: D-beta-D-heptose 7-phosphate kinase/D-beta-D-heptose 1-phosphate adenosyltransferase [Candidatus Azotimanducaceae bacterium]|jgi:D-beta-D-heptose 7-phosphate kinase/D-beta-D-heptose 1-phosphate adenosyltransferase